MSRSDIEALVHHIYAVRASNDAAKSAGLFAPGATFQLAGSPGPGRVAATSGDDMHAMMQSLVAAWEWLEHDILDLVVEGDKAAVHYRAKMRFIPTNQVVTTDLFDLVTFAGGKIVRLVEFCDTALATDLITAAMANAVGKGRA